MNIYVLLSIVLIFIMVDYRYYKTFKKVEKNEADKKNNSTL